LYSAVEIYYDTIAYTLLDIFYYYRECDCNIKRGRVGMTMRFFDENLSRFCGQIGWLFIAIY